MKTYVDEQRSYDKQEQKLHDFSDDTASHKSKWKLSFSMWRFALLVCKINIVLHYFAFDMKFRKCNKDDDAAALSPYVPPSSFQLKWQRCKILGKNDFILWSF